MKQGTDDNTVAKLSGISVLFLPSSLLTLFRQCEKNESEITRPTSDDSERDSTRWEIIVVML